MTATRKRLPFNSNPDTMGGKPVFTGTRVPVSYLFEYLAAGDSLDGFLEATRA